MAISIWPTLVAGRKNRLELAASVALSLATLLSIILICAEILRSPWPALLAIAVGVCVRSLGQQFKLNQVRHAQKPADLADFRFDGQIVSCHFEDSAIQNYTSSWQWRLAASAAAGLTCLLSQHIPGFGINVFTVDPLVPHWLRSLLEVCMPGLPLYIAALVFTIKGPEQRWANQLKSAIETRSATALKEILARQEIDGLGDGIDILWQKLGVDRRGEYRAALTRYIRTHTAESVLKPAAAIAMLEALTELARLDLKCLSAAIDRFERLQCEVRVVLALASASRNPLHETKAEVLDHKLGQLPLLAANRQWDDLNVRCGHVQTELDDLRERLSRFSVPVPTVMLPPGTDPYRLLGVTVDTPTPILRKLRSKLAQLYHPDVIGSTGNSSKMSELNAAYDAVMRDREKQGR